MNSIHDRSESARAHEGQLEVLAYYNLGEALVRRGPVEADRLLLIHSRSGTIQPGQIVFALDYIVEPDRRDDLLVAMAARRFGAELNADGFERLNGIAYSGPETVAQAAWYLSMIEDPDTARRARMALGEVLLDKYTNTIWGGDTTSLEAQIRISQYEARYGEDWEAWMKLTTIEDPSTPEWLRADLRRQLDASSNYLWELDHLRDLGQRIDSYYDIDAPNDWEEGKLLPPC